MERKDFLMNTGILAALGAFPGMSLANGTKANPATGVKPLLLQGLPPLDHNGGMEIRVWVRSAMTNGLFSSVECAVAPKTMGPAPHHHKELDELMYVLEGTASVLVGEEIVEVNAGGWHLRPRMITHTFWNSTDKPLRFIDMYFNQPFEEFLERVFYQLTEANGFPDGSEVKTREINRLVERFGLVYGPDAGDKRNELMKRFGLMG